VRWAALVVVLLGFGACGPGSTDAPRPVGPYPATDMNSPEDLHSPDDDDNDGLSNDQDGCPLAAEPWNDPVRDGCPTVRLDAGTDPL
jgi:hypothetical protein